MYPEFSVWNLLVEHMASEFFKSSNWICVLKTRWLCLILFQLFISGSGDELITPVYTPPPRPKWKDEDFNSNLNANSNNGANICDDDEDCRESGSGGFYEGLLFTGTFAFLIHATFQ